MPNPYLSHMTSIEPSIRCFVPTLPSSGIVAPQTETTSVLTTLEKSRFFGHERQEMLLWEQVWYRKHDIACVIPPLLRVMSSVSTKGTFVILHRAKIREERFKLSAFLSAHLWTSKKIISLHLSVFLVK